MFIHCSNCLHLKTSKYYMKVCPWTILFKIQTLLKLVDFLNFLWNCVCCRKTHWKFSVASQASTFKHTDSKISMRPTLAAKAYFNQSQYILLHWSFEWVLNVCQFKLNGKYSLQGSCELGKWANVGLKNLLLKSFFVYMDMLGDKCSLCVNVSFQMSFVFHRLFLWTSQLSCRSRSCLNLRSFIRSEPLFLSCMNICTYITFSNAFHT